MTFGGLHFEKEDLMKKLLAVCAAAVLLLSLAACGKTDTAVVITTKKDPTTSNEVQGVAPTMRRSTFKTTALSPWSWTATPLP